jgi:hypothetical protein
MAHKTRWLVAGFIVGAGMLVCLTSVVSLIVITKTPRFAGTLTPAPPTSGERILFLSYHKGSFDHGPDSWEGSTGHWRINVMRADGSSRGEFAVEPEEATSSAMWSPDGRKVLFGN